jgi:hypothetical protein
MDWAEWENLMRSLLVLVCLFVIAPAAHGQVQIQLGLDGCPLSVLPPYQPVSFQITALKFNGSRFESLAFRITGLSIDDQVIPLEITPNPEAAYAEGNPFEEGARITFPSCQEGTEPVLLYTATLVPLQAIDASLSEVRGDADCPIATDCDATETCFFSYLSMYQILMPPSNPYPPDGAVGVSPNVRLSVHWGDSCTCLGLPCTWLDFGVDPDPPNFDGGCDIPLPQPAPLQPFTKYYWRVREDYCGSVTSPVWSFTTGAPVAARELSWSHVKILFR